MRSRDSSDPSCDPHTTPCDSPDFWGSAMRIASQCEVSHDGSQVNLRSSPKASYDPHMTSLLTRQFHRRAKQGKKFLLAAGVELEAICSDTLFPPGQLHTFCLIIYIPVFLQPLQLFKNKQNRHRKQSQVLKLTVFMSAHII